MSSTLTVRALCPADDVVQAFGDFAAVLAWSKAKEEDLQFVLGLIGDETMDDFTELASIPIHLIIECISEWVKQKSPPPLQQSRLARFINVVRLKSRLEPGQLQRQTHRSLLSLRARRSRKMSSRSRSRLVRF